MNLLKLKFLNEGLYRSPSAERMNLYQIENLEEVVSSVCS